MTKATNTTRETLTKVFSRGRERPIVVTLHPNHLAIRLKGEKHVYHLDYRTLYTLGLRS